MNVTFNLTVYPKVRAWIRVTLSPITIAASVIIFGLLHCIYCCKHAKNYCLACPFFTAECKASVKIDKNTKLLEQPILVRLLKLEKRVRELAVQSVQRVSSTECRSDDQPTLLRETIFK